MKRLIIPVFTAAMLLSGCSKFLEERSQSEIIPTTVEDFSDLLVSEGYPSTTPYLYPQLMFMSDDMEFYASSDLRDNSALRVNYPAFQWQPDLIEACRLAGSNDTQKFNTWKIYYEMLQRVNLVLQYIDDAKGTQSEREFVKGSALMLRAYYYFVLTNIYGLPYKNTVSSPEASLSVPLKLDGNVVEATIPRNTVADVYAQIKKDIDAAIILLEKDRAARNLKFVSASAAHHLAARIALFTEDWEGVVRHSDYVLARHPELIDLAAGGDVNVVSQNNKESIWYYYLSNEFQSTFGLLSLVDVSKELYDSFDDKDLRKQLWIFATPPELSMWIPADYGSLKYSESIVYLSWRSSEAYLNRAEGNLQLYKKNGDVGAAQKALDDLNHLRAHRFMPGDAEVWTMAPADHLLKLCREERRRELFQEETHRWFDLRRYGMPRIVHQYEVTPGVTQQFVLEQNDPQYTLPIPEEAMNRNAALIQNKQIPGTRLPQ